MPNSTDLAVKENISQFILKKFACLVSALRFGLARKYHGASFEICDEWGWVRGKRQQKVDETQKERPFFFFSILRIRDTFKGSTF